MLAIWPAPEAAGHYAAVTPLIAVYGAADLFGGLGDVLFDLYEILLRHNPEPLMRGTEFRDLRRSWHRRSDGPVAVEAWQTAWAARFDTWQRKRAYDGLHTVLVAFYHYAGLQRPSFYHLADVADWARTLEMIAELRHVVVHGAAVVSDRLAALSNTQNSLTSISKRGSRSTSGFITCSRSSAFATSCSPPSTCRWSSGPSVRFGRSTTDSCQSDNCHEPAGPPRPPIWGGFFCPSAFGG